MPKIRPPRVRHGRELRYEFWDWTELRHRSVEVLSPPVYYPGTCWTFRHNMHYPGGYIVYQPRERQPRWVSDSRGRQLTVTQQGPVYR